MAKYAAYGSLLKRSGTTVAQLSSISGPSLSAETIDVTTHDSSNAAREFVAGLIDGGTVDIEGVYDPDNASQTSLRTDLVARTPVTYTITFTDTTPAIVTVSLLWTSFTPSAAADGALSFSASAKVTGLPTWA